MTGLRGKWLIAAITATCSVAQLLFGYDQGMTAGLADLVTPNLTLY